MFIIRVLFLCLDTGGQKTETWAVELWMGEVSSQFKLDILRPDCWNGAITGKGILNTEEPQEVIAQGTLFKNGDFACVGEAKGMYV